MPYKKIDAKKISVLPLAQRKSFIDIQSAAVSPDAALLPAGEAAAKITALAHRIAEAKKRSAAVMLTYGAHVVKNGCGLLVNSFIESGVVTHLATQGAGIIHDWEFAFQGKSSESVKDNVAAGQFGTWVETGKYINLAIIAGAAEGLGAGEAIGKFIAEDGLTLPKTDELRKFISSQPEHPLAAARADLLKTMLDFNLPPGRMKVAHPFKKYSISACAFIHRVPLTVHPGIGYDIIVNHPMFSGAALGRAAETDARVFANSAYNLTDGVYLSVGSAIMSPQIFEKALSAVNNIRQQEGKDCIHGHCIAIADIARVEWDWNKGEPPKDHPAYYARFCKTFYRMGGEVAYICGDNRMFLANLLAELKKKGCCR